MQILEHYKYHIIPLQELCRNNSHYKYVIPLNDARIKPNKGDIKLLKR